MENCNWIKIVDFLWSDSKDDFKLFLAVFGWYNPTCKKFILFIWWKIRKQLVWLTFFRLSIQFFLICGRIKVKSYLSGHHRSVNILNLRKNTKIVNTNPFVFLYMIKILSWLSASFPNISSGWLQNVYYILYYYIIHIIYILLTKLNCIHEIFHQNDLHILTFKF